MAVIRTATSGPPELSYRLRAVEPYPITGDFMSLGIRVVDAEDRLLHTYGVVLTNEKQAILAHRFGLNIDALRADAETIDAVYRWGVRRVTSILTSGPPQWDPAVTTTRLTIEEEDLPGLARAWGPKGCEFQLRERRRLVCTAASKDDPTAIATDGLTTYAPTTNSVCRTCAMPDGEYLCSHLVNPEVFGTSTDQQGVVLRTLSVAMCQQNRPEIGDPAGCRAGGHACWERVIDVQPPDSVMPPLAIVGALDYLDAAWRGSGVAGHDHLFKHLSAELLGDLTQPCTTRAGFRDRVSALDTVLKNMNVPTDDSSFTNEVKGAGPLVRLKHFVAIRLEAHPDNAAMGADVRTAVDQLLAINKLRTAIQHIEAHNVDLPTTLAVFHIASPVGDWAAAWRRVETVAVSSLGVIARALGQL
ncbi:MAG: hypothetical protein ACYDAC_10215 [Candidatus Dormibacteria bacterium]